MTALSSDFALNGICPYFTMFPLAFPLRILKERSLPGELVLDPFCGRGTTNFAARLSGLKSVGVDSSPVATAITAAKLIAVKPKDIIDEAEEILCGPRPKAVPEGEFWRWAYAPRVLDGLCRIREALLDDCSSDKRIALRGIALGALHGPKQKIVPGYLSNQCPRTFAPKPGYSIRFWKEKELEPESVNVLAVIERRARRYYQAATGAHGQVRLADSRISESLRPLSTRKLFDWVITSPPYYGMRTYIPDQWLRNWFLGGPPEVVYLSPTQLEHSSPSQFSDELRCVWDNAATVSNEGARLVVRFGAIANRNADPISIIKKSLHPTSWRIKTIRAAGSANEGKRQADAFLRLKSEALYEYDIWAVRQ